VHRSRRTCERPFSDPSDEAARLVPGAGPCGATRALSSPCHGSRATGGGKTCTAMPLRV